jgi:hypothetical protein
MPPQRLPALCQFPHLVNGCHSFEFVAKIDFKSFKFQITGKQIPNKDQISDFKIPNIARL